MSDWWIFDVGGWRMLGAVFMHGAAGFVGFGTAALVWGWILLKFKQVKKR